ncbi:MULTISPECIES: Fur-regulated basic protein FbpA [unclassified Psychrobacillus]|uniref:Fur-regulated basic protein FbpA n=1 Tax=unclassified Psychrobacillus TaxID=2636677 RepID=UPI001469AAC2|nr:MULTISPECIES: Fur-regulated basic protein FbpA [unclassified Psychrobacillus]MCM3360053.1 Fur-regulated basic protein FbpA [Psychrobacillus sp. MER TA 171]NME07023.1 Fur-regulated basic protein FbpA [Psychrobacillus sp. BL-248-WT-3]
MMIQKDTQTEKRRDNIIEDLVNKGVFKIDGKQLYELNFYQLMKQYINDEKQTN